MAIGKIDERRFLLGVMLFSSLVGILVWYVERLANAPLVEWGRATVTTFSFFTIFTNGMIVIMAGALLYGRGRLHDRFDSPGVQSACCLYIAFVGLGFWFLLGGPGQMVTFWDYVPQVTAHTLSPILGAIYWFRVVPKGELNWRHPFLWLLYPLAYLVFWLFRGPIVGYYPYFFLDVNALGYVGVAKWSAVLMLAFLILGTAMFFFDRLRGEADSKGHRLEPTAET